MRSLRFAILLFLTIQVAHAQQLKLSTSSDSAVYYYYQGWKQVMDEGNYSAAEVSYRKMMQFDSEFLVGLCLLGRITQDLKEREQIETQLEKRRQEVKGDEKLLFDVFIELVKLTNLRERNPNEAKIQMEKAFALGEQNLRAIVHKYPDEIYYKAEYIEVLHRNYGAQMALDSLYNLASQSQQHQPFLLGYAAQLEAEVGHFEKALEKATTLAEVAGKQSLKPHVVHSDIYFKMGNFEKALNAIDTALKLDPGNIEAQKLQTKILKEVKK